MATKAEMFRYLEQRSHPKKNGKVEEKPGHADERHKKRALYVHEPGRPSRKSTRRSENHAKPSEVMHLATVQKRVSNPRAA